MDLITEIWAGLNDAGMPEVMLYLPDGSAYRCHWNDTALVGAVRVALVHAVGQVREAAGGEDGVEHRVARHHGRRGRGVLDE